jgi:hypothetical protein
LLRIGIREASWIGSFERGHTKVNIVSMLPDGKHLFVCVGGAGYVIDSKSRTLVERIGTEVIGAIEDDFWMLFIICHNDTSLEAFGSPVGVGGVLREARDRRGGVRLHFGDSES